MKSLSSPLDLLFMVLNFIVGFHVLNEDGTIHRAYWYGRNVLNFVVCWYPQKLAPHETKLLYISQVLFTNGTDGF